MISLTLLFLVVVVFCCISHNGAENILGDWENPSDIFGMSKSGCGKELDTLREDLKYCHDDLQTIREKNRCKGPRVVKQPSVAEHYVKRFINVLLASANFKHRTLMEGNEISVNTNLYFNSKTLPVLQAFASEDTNGHSWSELDSSFITLFEGDPNFKGIYIGLPNDESSTYFSDGMNRIGINHLTVLIGVVSSVGFSVIWIYIKGGSFRASMFVGFVLVVSLCFGWTWWSEVENQKTKYLVELSNLDTVDGELPDSCKNPNGGWFGWFLKSSRKEECFQYLKAKNIHPMASVDLAHVFSKTLQTLFFSWLPALAKSTSDAIDAFFGTSFFGWCSGYLVRILTGPLVALMLLIAFAVYMVSGKSFRFKTFFWEMEYGSRREAVTHEESAHPIVQQVLPAVEQGDTEANSSADSIQSATQKRNRIAAFSSKNLHRTKKKPLLRHDSVPLSLPSYGPVTTLARNKTKVVGRKMSPLDPLCLSPDGNSRRQADERRFRDIRRAFSFIERPVKRTTETTYYSNPFES